MLLFALDDSTWIQIVTLIVGCITTCFTGWISWQVLIVKARQKKGEDAHVLSANRLEDSIYAAKEEVKHEVKEEVKKSADNVIANVSPLIPNDPPPM